MSNLPTKKLEYTDGIDWYNLATENYVNKLIKLPVEVATTLNLAATYANGTSGVGATLTNFGTQAALVIDGVTLVVGNRVLVKDQTAALQNGIYIVTNIGSSTTNWVLTRAIDYDSNYLINKGDIAVVTSGTTNGYAAWMQNTSETTDIGIRNINFVTFSNSSSLIGNTLKAYNQNNINVTSSLFVNDDGTYNPYYGIYGYLNSSGQVGIGTSFPSQQNSYSINCNNKIKASEFNAVSSKEIKNILTQDIDEEALEIFKKINFSKYQYKDKVKNGFSTIYGLIAEDLFSVVPDWVSEDFDFVPNIMTKALIKKLKNNTYKLSGNFNFDFDLEQNSLKIIGNNESYVVSILEKKQDKLIIKNDQDMKLEKEIFVYGTYKKCPSITKNNVFELGLVVLKGLIKRLEKLEEKYV